MSNNDKLGITPGWAPKTQVVRDLKGDQRERVDLEPSKFDTLVQQKGVWVKVYRTMYCPQVKSIDGAEHEINCKICNGSGFLDVKPFNTLVFLQNQALEKMPFAEGFVDGNTVAATFMKGVELQYFTLVELVDFTEIFYERVKRSEGKVDVLKYKPCNINTLMDSFGKDYVLGSHFTIDPNGNIKWRANKGPKPGTIYTIHYEAAVQFRATRAMHTNRFTQVRLKDKSLHVKMNEQWLLTKEFLVKRKDLAGNEMLPNPIYESNE